MVKKSGDSEILARIKERRTLGEDNIRALKDEIEADIALIRWKKKKGKEGLIGDFSMSAKVKNLVARSYRNKTPIYIRPTQNGSERIAKAQNKLYQEDRDTPAMKAIRYYKETDKYTTGLAIIAKVGWDWKKKSPIWTRINPLLAVPDPYGDYFIGDYRYIGFYGLKTKEEMETDWWDTSVSQDAVDWEKEAKRVEQQNAGALYQQDQTIFDIYYHFEEERDYVMMYATNGNCTHIHARKKLKKFPFSFFYWQPNGTFYGDRPANYVRDSQKWKAEMRNLQADKVRQEVYGLWLYNSDYVSGKDVGFGVNKKVPIKTGLDWAQVSLSNIVSKVPVDTNITNTNQFIQEIEQDVTVALGIGDIAQGSLPDRREALGTNKLVMDQTDIILSLNEEMDTIGEQQFVELWYDSYYEKFTEADKKVIYAGSSTGQSPIIVTRKDFIIDGNLSLAIETSKEREQRMVKEMAWRTQNSPLILQDPTINEASKRLTLRKMLLAGWADMEDVEEEVPMPAQYMKQIQENELLKRWISIDIHYEDDDDQHLVAMWDVDPNDVIMVMHQMAHIAQKISKWESKSEVNPMLNNAMSQAMSQAGSQTAALNSNQ